MIKVVHDPTSFGGSRIAALCRRSQPLVDALFGARGKAGHAFLDLPDDTALLRKIKSFAAREKKNGWENIVVLGIGGSALGLIALRDALLPPFAPKPRLFVLDNIDPDHTAALFSAIDFRKTLFIVISKSGETVEPMLLYGLVKERLEKTCPKDFRKHLIFITDPTQGLLRAIAEKEDIETFDVPAGVGGRFSVLSAVGLLPAALAGADIGGLLKGARAMRDRIKKEKSTENPALMLAAMQFVADREQGKPMTVLMPYSQRLFRLGDWYRQLLAESIGKNSLSGPTPLNALGTTDQHSQLQLYSDGPDNKWFIFMRVLRHDKNPRLGAALPAEMSFLNGHSMGEVMDAAYHGTAASLTEKGRSNVTLEIDRVNAENLGALFMLLECQVALLGDFYGVNAFDQPGVEASKIITKRILSSPKKRGFTLAEMTIVIAILGILAGLGLRTFSTERRQFAFNDSLSQIVMFIKTARNYAITSRAVTSDATTGEPDIPADGYGVYLEKSATPGASKVILFANNGSNSAIYDNTDTVEANDTFFLPPETVFEAILNKDTGADFGDKATILFKPPFGDASVNNNASPPVAIETLSLQFSNRYSPAGVSARTISFNRVSGFPELELLP